MKFCQHCGKEIMDEAVICPGCGCSVQATNDAKAAEVAQYIYSQGANIGLVVLSVFIPLFGFIYWPLKAKTEPKTARACGIAAIISFTICFFISFICLLIAEI